LKDRCDFLESQMLNLMSWAARREKDFNDIEIMAQEEKEKNEFRESNR
jgi:hypothetical protein